MTSRQKSGTKMPKQLKTNCETNLALAKFCARIAVDAASMKIEPEFLFLRIQDGVDRIKDKHRA